MFEKIDEVPQGMAIVIPKGTKIFKAIVLENGIGDLERVEYSGHKGFLIKASALESHLALHPDYFDYIGNTNEFSITLDKLSGGNVKHFKSLIDLSGEEEKTGFEFPKTIFSEMDASGIKKYVEENDVKISFKSNWGKGAMIKAILKAFPEDYLIKE